MMTVATAPSPQRLRCQRVPPCLQQNRHASTTALPTTILLLLLSTFVVVVSCTLFVDATVTPSTSGRFSPLYSSLSPPPPCPSKAGATSRCSRFGVSNVAAETNPLPNIVAERAECVDVGGRFDDLITRQNDGCRSPSPFNIAAEDAVVASILNAHTERAVNSCFGKYGDDDDDYDISFDCVKKARTSTRLRVVSSSLRHRDGQFGLPSLVDDEGTATTSPLYHIVSSNGGLATTALLAWANHYPLSLRPDDLWGQILVAVANHIGLHSTELRESLVGSSGSGGSAAASTPGEKETLIVDVDSSFNLDDPSEWQKDVFPTFTSILRKRIGGDIVDSVVGKGEAEVVGTQPLFSTTTPLDTAIYQVSLMGALKSYFNYEVRVDCGIPWVELKGTLADWEKLREGAVLLKRRMLLPAFGVAWVDHHLLPVLDEFVEEVRHQQQSRIEEVLTSSDDGDRHVGSAPPKNIAFWNRIVKYIPLYMVCGAEPSVNGWINVFYPYIFQSESLVKNHLLFDQMKGQQSQGTATASDGTEGYTSSLELSDSFVDGEYRDVEDLDPKNGWKSNMNEYGYAGRRGPTPNEFLDVLVDVPILVDRINMTLMAGNKGVLQDRDTLALRPLPLWLLVTEADGSKNQL